MRIVVSILLAVLVWIGFGMVTMLVLPLLGAIAQAELPYQQLSAIGSLIGMGLGIYAGIAHFRSRPRPQEAT